MDNLLYEGQVTYTRDIFKESIKTWLYKSKIWLILLYPIIIIILGIVMLIQKNSIAFLAIGIFCVIILLLIIFIRYSLNIKIGYNRSCEQNKGQEINNIVQFFHDTILLTNTLTNNKISYGYNSIKKIVESKNLIIITTQARLMIIVEKSTIIIGTPNELIAFIKLKLGKS